MGAGSKNHLTPTEVEDFRKIPPIVEKIEEEDETDKVKLLDEKHKFFNLMKSQHKTLAQKVTAGMNKSGLRHNFKEQPSFIDSSHPSSSYDSINPQDLVLPTQTANSNYNSGVSNTPAT